MQRMLEEQMRRVEQFHLKVTGMPIPPAPTMLTGARRTKAMEFLLEEADEFDDAVTAADQADALVDLIYVAMGRLLEMGIRPGPAFDLVHERNMAKVGGANKRGTTWEAAKPDGWYPPDWNWFFANEIAERGKYIGLTRVDYPRVEPDPDLALRVCKEPDPRVSREEDTFGGPLPRKNNSYARTSLPKMKVLLMGYGRHGKDTVAELLRDHYGLAFTSSSLFCAERVMMPHFLEARAEYMDRPASQRGVGPFPVVYDTAEDCFADRHSHRAEWFKAIEAFNTPDKSALGWAIFAEHDLYVGIRSAREFAAVKNAGLYDVAIWVDALQRHPAEDRSSCTVEPWMADYVIDNNGTLDELAFNTRQLMDRIIADAR